MLKMKKLLLAGLLGLGLMSPFVTTEAHAMIFNAGERGYLQTYDDNFKVYGIEGDTITGHYDSDFRGQNGRGHRVAGDFKIDVKQMTVFINVTSFDNKPYYEDYGQLYAYRGGEEGQVLAKYIVGMTNYYRPDLLPTWKAKILFEGR